MTIKEIDNAIEVLKVCQYCWANNCTYDNEIISDYDAITQAIKCLKEYKEAQKNIKATS